MLFLLVHSNLRVEVFDGGGIGRGTRVWGWGGRGGGVDGTSTEIKSDDEYQNLNMCIKLHI